MCHGNRVIFTCQQAGFTTQWRININQILRQTVRSTQVGSVITFGAESGFNFELHIVSNSSGNFTTELQVTAVRELNGVTVECIGFSGTSTSIIEIASIGEFVMINYFKCTSMKTLQLLQVESWQPISSSQKLEPQ